MRGTKPAALVAGTLPVDTIPRAPTWLGKHARAEWRRIMPNLIDRRILTGADLGGIENYCAATGRIREIEILIRKAAGAIDPVLFRMQDKAMQTARQIAAEYGLTPVARSRPSIRDDAGDDSADDLGLD